MSEVSIQNELNAHSNISNWYHLGTCYSIDGIAHILRLIGENWNQSGQFELRHQCIQHMLGCTYFS